MASIVRSSLCSASPTKSFTARGQNAFLRLVFDVIEYSQWQVLIGCQLADAALLDYQITYMAKLQIHINYDLKLILIKFGHREFQFCHILFSHPLQHHQGISIVYCTQKRGTDYVHSSIGDPKKTLEHEWYKQPTLYARTAILSCAHLRNFSGFLKASKA